MKTDLEKAVTLRDLMQFAEEHNLSPDTPIGVAVCDEGRASICYGIVIDTPDESCPFDEEEFDFVRGENTGEHCKCHSYSPVNDLLDRPVNERVMLMFTDGWHDEL